MMIKVERIRELLMWTIREKNKKYLWEARKVMETMTSNEKAVLFADEEIQEMTIIIDRNILPRIDKKHVPYGPPVENQYERKI